MAKAKPWIILRVNSTKALAVADTLFDAECRFGERIPFFVPVRLKVQHLNGMGAKKNEDRKEVPYACFPNYVFARVEPNHPRLKAMEKRGMIYGYLHKSEGQACIVPQEQIDVMRVHMHTLNQTSNIYREYDPARHKEKTDAGDGAKRFMKSGYEFDKGDWVHFENGVTPAPLKVMSFEKQDKHAKVSFEAFGKLQVSSIAVERLILWKKGPPQEYAKAS